MFGSNQKYKIADEFTAMANQSQNDIDALKNGNPFETAASKSAMVKASQGAQDYYNRSMNVMGANASPEAMVAAQGQASDAMAGAAGNIATGAEANRNAQLEQLKALQLKEMGTSADIKVGAIDKQWDGFFKGIDTISNTMQGGGTALGSIMKAGATGA
jgi:hypothetical protein